MDGRGSNSAPAGHFGKYRALYPLLGVNRLHEPLLIARRQVRVGLEAAPVTTALSDPTGQLGRRAHVEASKPIGHGLKGLKWQACIAPRP